MDSLRQQQHDAREFLGEMYSKMEVCRLVFNAV